VLGLVALLRLVTWDSAEPLIVVDALTLIVYLPAWVVAARALITRRWWLAAAAAVVVAAQVGFAAPEPPLRSRSRASHRAGPPRSHNSRRVHATGAAQHGGVGRASELPLPLRGACLRRDRPLAPFPAYWREWAAALAAVGRSVRASGDSSMLMVGDFNATWGNSGFVALLHDGLADGAAARGKRHT
jgi:hypothetical protein